MPRTPYRGPSMTLANTRENGVRSLSVTSELCHHGALMNARAWYARRADCRGRRAAELERALAAREPNRHAVALRGLVFLEYAEDEIDSDHNHKNPAHHGDALSQRKVANSKRTARNDRIGHGMNFPFAVDTTLLWARAFLASPPSGRQPIRGCCCCWGSASIYRRLMIVSALAGPSASIAATANAKPAAIAK
jgi:hypothetical protein